MKLNMNSQADAFGYFLQTMESDSLKDALYRPYMNGRERGFVIAADFKAGKEAAMKALVGKVMMLSRGKANPQLAEKLLREKLSI